MRERIHSSKCGATVFISDCRRAPFGPGPSNRLAVASMEDAVAGVITVFTRSNSLLCRCLVVLGEWF